MKILALITIIFLIVSCDISGVKKNKKSVIPIAKKQEKGNPDELKKLSLQAIKKLGTENIGNGIKITYFVHGKGSQLSQGDVVQLNYEVLLENGTMVDGNKLLKRPWLPFLVGYGMQTPGWDIALKKLHIGDFVEIYLPAKMARGEQEIKGLIPSNSVNILRIKILGIIAPTRVIDGTKVWVLEESEKESKKASLDDEIEFHYMVGTETNPKYDISYRRNQPYKLRFSDYGIVKGLKKSLINAKKSDKIWVLVPPEEAYGEKGLQNLVKPNEHVFYDIFVMNVQ